MKLESAGGITLLTIAIFALALANSFLSPYYFELLNTPVVVQFGEQGIAKPFLLWINDGFMAVFFVLVGLEVKREIMLGSLSLPTSYLAGISRTGRDGCASTGFHFF